MPLRSLSFSETRIIHYQLVLLVLVLMFSGCTRRSRATISPTEKSGVLPAPPRRVFVTHGEPDAAQAMAAHIRDRFGWTVEVPQYGERFELI